jgi:S1-C subfamily serine protease
MSLQSLELGIDAVKKGNRSEGARLLRIALKSGELNNYLRAVALIALAETTDDPQQKMKYYREALAADPGNADANQRLARLLGAQIPTTPPVTPPPPPSTLPGENPSPQGSVAARGVNIAGQIVSVIGGLNGPGTAFFVTRDGLLATTRFVVGGADRLTLELDSGRQLTGYVVRAYPEIDLALLYADTRVSELLPITPHTRIPNETPLTALAYNGQVLRGKVRDTKRVMPPHWIATDLVKLVDAGGDPLFDGSNHLAGMLTRNNSRSSGYVFALHITTIRRCVEAYIQEINGREKRVYCIACGVLSRSIGAGYFYCEVCGHVNPLAESMARYPIAEAEVFYEQAKIRCTRCNAQVGFFQDGRCLRCGQKPEPPKVR